MSKLIAQIITILFGVAGVILAIAALSLLLAYPLKWTWNSVIPYLFDLKTLSVGQAWCLAFVCSCLIKPSTSRSKSED